MVEDHIQGKAKTLGVVDNDMFALWAMKKYLARTLDGITPEWMTTRADTAIARCTMGRSPDVLLVGMPMCGIDGISVIRAIRERNRHTSMVAMTLFPLGEYASAVSMAGAQAIAGKNDPRGLRDTIRFVAMGGVGSFDGIDFPTVDEAFSRILQEPKTGIALLTDREIEIIELCRRGDTSMLIAKRTGLAVASVNTYIQRACGKLGARNRTHLVSMWLELSRPRHSS